MKRTYVVLENGLYGIYDENTNIFTEDNKIINKKHPEEPVEDVEWRKVPIKTRKLLSSILELKHERISRNEKQKDIQKQIEEMEQKVIQLKEEHNSLETERKIYQREIEKMVKEYADEKKLSSIMNSIKGNEVEEMSFYNGTLDRVRAKAIIIRSKRPCTYTYGYEYRKPTTCHSPRTKEEAIDIVLNESLLDISFGKDEIHLNAYSSNDMW